MNFWKIVEDRSSTGPIYQIESPIRHADERAKANGHDFKDFDVESMLQKVLGDLWGKGLKIADGSARVSS